MPDPITFTGAGMAGEYEQLRQSKTIHVKLGKQYNQEVVIPVCDKAKTFAQIAGTKTLTRGVVALIKQLGYRIEVVPTEPKEL